MKLVFRILLLAALAFFTAAQPRTDNDISQCSWFPDGRSPLSPIGLPFSQLSAHPAGAYGGTPDIEFADVLLPKFPLPGNHDFRQQKCRIVLFPCGAEVESAPE
jgi:hypothetical protein